VKEVTECRALAVTSAVIIYRCEFNWNVHHVSNNVTKFNLFLIVSVI
jgi:hypothetical protein